MEKDFCVGQLVAYCPTNPVYDDMYYHNPFDDDSDDEYMTVKSGDEIYKVELGIIKRIDEENNRAFVWYHMGSTVACTPLDDLYPIENGYCFENYKNGINSLDKEE
jgi:hypothetical protein